MTNYTQGDEIIFKADEWLNEGRQVAIATVVSAWGSSPRPVGSQLVIDENGKFEGSVSGGCVEAAVISAGIEVIYEGQPRLLEFGISDNEAWDIGLACGGKIRIYIEPVVDTDTGTDSGC